MDILKYIKKLIYYEKDFILKIYKIIFSLFNKNKIITFILIIIFIIIGLIFHYYIVNVIYVILIANIIYIFFLFYTKDLRDKTIRKMLLKYFIYSLIILFSSTLAFYIILPKDQKEYLKIEIYNIKINLYKELFKIKFNILGVDENSDVKNILKNCLGYINKDVCEEVLIYMYWSKKQMDNSKKIYTYCKEKENINKNYCDSNSNIIEYGKEQEMCKNITIELIKWRKINKIDPNIVSINDSNCEEVIVRDLQIRIDDEKKYLINGIYIFLRKNNYYYRDEYPYIDIDIERDMSLENFKKILDILKEEIDNLGNI